MGPIFVAVRHGSYDDNSNLSVTGRQQMMLLSVEMQKVVDANPGIQIVLLCSTAPRARQGGQILEDKLAILPESSLYCECLWVDDSHGGDWENTRRLVAQWLKDDTLLIVLSHLDVVPSIARHVADKFGSEGRIYSRGYAEGWMVTRDGVTPVSPAKA